MRNEKPDGKMSRKKQKSLRGYIEDVQGELCKIVDIYLSELSNREKIEGALLNSIHFLCLL